MRLKEEFERYKVFIFDIDGVIWIGGKPLPQASKTLRTLIKYGKRVILLTNNSTRSREEYYSKLKKLCNELSINDIITSGYATATFLRSEFGKLRLYVIGEMGLARELVLQGHVLLSEDAKQSFIDAVVVGLDRQLHYSRLSKGLRAILNGSLFIATNEDPTVPAENGVEPGAGAIIAALSVAARRRPDYVIGKPNKYIFEIALKGVAVPRDEVLVIGDRIDTDIVGAKSIGAASALTLTGVTSEHELKMSDIKPDYVLKSLNDLFKF